MPVVRTVLSPRTIESNVNRNSINCTKPWLIGQQTAIASSLSARLVHCGSDKGGGWGVWVKKALTAKRYCVQSFKWYMILFRETIYLLKIAQLRKTGGKQYLQFSTALKVLVLIKSKNLKILLPKAIMCHRQKCLSIDG